MKEFESYPLGNFRVRFKTLEELSKANQEQLDNFFGHIVKQSLLMAASEPVLSSLSHSSSSSNLMPSSPSSSSSSYSTPVSSPIVVQSPVSPGASINSNNNTAATVSSSSNSSVSSVANGYGNFSNISQIATSSLPNSLFTTTTAAKWLEIKDRSTADYIASRRGFGIKGGSPFASTFTPWFEYFREQYPLDLRGTDHESFDHPVACMSVVSSKNPDPIKAFRELYDPNTPPQIFDDNEMDPNIFILYVLIHDQRDGNSDK